MMQGQQQPERQEQNLADLLADDQGNLRPEVADILMGERPRRRIHQPRRRVNQPRRPIQLPQIPIPPRGILIIGALFLAFFIGRFLRPSGRVKKQPEAQEKRVMAPVQEKVRAVPDRKSMPVTGRPLLLCTLAQPRHMDLACL